MVGVVRDFQILNYPLPPPHFKSHPKLTTDGFIDATAFTIENWQSHRWLQMFMYPYLDSVSSPANLSTLRSISQRGTCVHQATCMRGTAPYTINSHHLETEYRFKVLTRTPFVLTIPNSCGISRNLVCQRLRSNWHQRAQSSMDLVPN